MALPPPPAPGPMPEREPDPAALADLADLAVGLATTAGELLVEGLSRVRSSVRTKSTTTDLVTEMDRASERLIVEGILAVRPDDGILGEEGTDRPGTSGWRWIIDPLDGTTNYVYGHAGFAVSIAVEARRPGGPAEVVAGVVVDPLHGDTFRAVRGAGATRNGTPVRCSDETRLGHALVATGFGYDADRRRAQAATLGQVIGVVRDIRRMGAAAVDLCSVACGRVDGYYERGLAEWDYAAGALIAVEAGARVGDLRGGPPSPTCTLAAPPALFDELRDRLAAAGADRD